MSKATRGPAVRITFLLILACAEMTVAAGDSRLRAYWGNEHWWAGWLGFAHVVPQILLAAGVGVFLFGGGRLRRELATVGPGSHRWGAALGVHFALLVGCALLWRPAFSRESPDPAFAALWAGTVLATAVAWALAVFPARTWLRLFVRAWDVWLLVGVVTAVSVAASRGTAGLWGDLADWTLAAVRRVLGLFTNELVYDAADQLVGTAEFSVRIRPICAGYEGLGLATAFVASFVWLRRDELRFPQSIALIPIALLAAWAANVLRIVVLIGLGSAGYADIAIGGFHSLAGWLTFNAVAVGVVALGQLRPFRAERREPEANSSNPAGAYLVPWLVVLGTALITAAFSPDGFDRFYGLRVFLGLVAIWEFRWAYTRLGWGWSWSAVGLGAFVFAAWVAWAYAISPDPDANTASHVRSMSPYWSAVWIVGRIVGSVFVVPIVEELAFRGYLMRRLAGSHFETVVPALTQWFAVLASSVLFGALHGRMWLPGVLAGLTYAWAYRRRDRLGDAILAHATTNGLIAIAVLSGHWALWE